MARGLPFQWNSNDPTCIIGVLCAGTTVAGKDTKMTKLEFFPSRDLGLLEGVRQVPQKRGSMT